MASGAAGAEFIPALSGRAPTGAGGIARAYGARARLFNAGRLLAAGFVAVLLLGLWASPARATPLRILALGDSLTAGFGLDPQDAYPVKLAAALKAKGYDATIINAGVSGDTSAGGLARLDWALSDHPDVALVELGANDALRGLDPAAAEANLDRILATLEAAHVKILLMGMLAPNNWGADYAAHFNAIYPALARRHQVALYPFFLDGVALDPTLNQPDMLHPTAAGVDVIVARSLPAILRLLGPPPLPTPPS